MSTQRMAVIDIGTVTARLLVADVTDGTIQEVARRSAITHLGEGWTSSGALSEAGIARTETAVASFVEEARSLGAFRLTAVGTSATRDADNGQELVRRLHAIRVPLEIISGEHEGYLTFLGATYGFCDRPVLVVDVGGGSTELVLGSTCLERNYRRVSLEMSRSIDVGSRRVTELFLHSDPPTADEMDHAAAWIADELRACLSELGGEPFEMVAVAGTATSLAAIDLALDPYDPTRVHGHRIGGAQLLGMLERLSALTLVKRRHVIGLEAERAGVIVGGALILQSVMAHAGVSSTLVSEHDILYGMVLETDQRERLEQ